MSSYGWYEKKFTTISQLLTCTPLIDIVKTFFKFGPLLLDGHILELGLGFCYSITWWLASSYGYTDNNTKQEVSMGANDAAGLNHYKLFAMCIIWSIDTCRIIYDSGAIPTYRTKKNAPKLTGFPGDFTEFTVPSGGQNI